MLYKGSYLLCVSSFIWNLKEERLYDLRSYTSPRGYIKLEPRRRLSNMEIEEYVDLSKSQEYFQFSSEDDDRQWEDGKVKFSAKTIGYFVAKKRRLGSQLGI